MNDSGTWIPTAQACSSHGKVFIQPMETYSHCRHGFSAVQTFPPLHPAQSPSTANVSLKVKCSLSGSTLEEPRSSSQPSLGHVRSLSGLNAKAHSRSAPPWFLLHDHLLVQLRCALCAGCLCVHINLHPLVFLPSSFSVCFEWLVPALHGCKSASLQGCVLLTATAH